MDTQAGERRTGRRIERLEEMGKVDDESAAPSLPECSSPGPLEQRGKRWVPERTTIRKRE